MRMTADRQGMVTRGDRGSKVRALAGWQTPFANSVEILRYGSKNSTLPHRLKTFHKVCAATYPGGKLIECLNGAV
jgi:hypothetical protein